MIGEIGKVILSFDEFVEALNSSTMYDVSISIKGKHHIIDGFMSEIYGISHYSFLDDEIKRSPMFVPTILSPSNEHGEESVYVGDDPYDTFGFEPYLCVDNNSLFHREGIYENYEVSLVGHAGLAGSDHDPVTISYAPEVNCMLTLYPDGSVEFSYGYSDRVVLRFAENGVFAAYNGNDAASALDGGFSIPAPLFVHTHGISVKKLADDTSGEKDSDDHTVTSLDGYAISLCYTLRTPGGVCEEASIEFVIKPIKNNKRGENHEN